MSHRPLSRTSISALVAIAPLACTSAQPPVDEQHAANRMNAAEWRMREYQQQPHSNPRSGKLVRQQPVEDPLNAGRDLQR
jgi:hypothetical protein